MNYTRNSLDNDASRSVDLLVRHLKVHGGSSTTALAQVLGMSAEAVRQHLVKLVQQGLIESERSSSGVGRPKQLWTLTTAGHARFPDTHAQLTVHMIQAIAQVFGAQGMQRIIENRSEQQLAEYQAMLSSSSSLVERLTLLARLRDAEGYMARVECDGMDFLLIEDHCPICAAATACQGFCTAELRQFQCLMDGWAEVTREEHLLHQARRCVYRFRATQALRPPQPNALRGAEE